ncbi:Peptidase M43, pregnancy-associated plasma-A [Cordyceps fumosorosea ARSEF 2679]|uniref:Peptidase M43, pregnancy-associated plasma-A n=1 Tax=Cordyceps fumosorosea (strain ARSEF 2679) TaxID=1081104 RepID=A0A168E1A6_CORFA|nr:Peptidase M43, pregnancy-associated plasma-A [Cordyceps fumosorosea ARSEF 2679]OAA73263.1 Peptidase M43, pregnancy-associated plasma-A [Cordyceps fumosorosea ARSEF 2679]
MRSVFLLPLALVLGAVAQDEQAGEDVQHCGTNSTDGVAHADFLIESRQKHVLQPFTIETYIHYVAPSNPPDKVKTKLQDSARKQLDVLNAAFEPSGISFTRNKPRFWADARFASIQSGSDLAAMIEKYRVGDDAKILNLFVPYSPSQKVLGTGACISFDDLFVRKTSPMSSDGCFIRPTTLPGHSFERYNEGKMAVHEVGHWLGLYHTFQGGCTGKGDFMPDTPAQAYETFGCNVTQDTCPDQPGLDPIHNYMGYSDE